MRVAFCSLWLLLTTCALTKAQTFKTTVDFKTPEVAAFNRFVETPVSYYTGVPSISIPIYEVNVNGITLPITLEYNAGGVQVNQDATWVGLGWSLGYGGQISRRERGMADEANFFQDTTIRKFLSLPGMESDSTLWDRSQYMWNAKTGLLDYMPDEFYYSCLGVSGKFMYNQQNSKFVLFPKEDVEIKYNKSPTDNSFIQSWDLTMPDGTKANFNTGSSSSIGLATRYVKNNWLLGKLTSFANDSILFSYDMLPTYYLTKIFSETETYWKESGVDWSRNSGPCFYNDVVLRRIKFKGGQVDFYLTDREDMPTKALSKVVVTDTQGKIIKQVDFNYSYFYGDAFNPPSFVIQDANYAFKRLKLDSLNISGNNINKAYAYKFDYYTFPQMPSKYSMAQDHYGFYNAIDNKTLVPNIQPSYYEGGDRRVKGDTSKVFSLKSITYPEGGKTEFLYEGNSITTWDAGIPEELKQMYQDDNMVDKYVALSISGYDRNYYYPLPDSMGSLIGERFFKKKFTVPKNGMPFLGFDFSCSTNIGATTIDKNLNLSCESANVEFSLFREDEDGNYTTMANQVVVRCEGTTRTVSTPTSAFLGLNPGNYLLQVRILFNAAGDAVNQNHSTLVTVRWRESDTIAYKLNVGGLRVKETRVYDNTGALSLNKKYQYENPINHLSSGNVISLPNYRKLMIKSVNVAAGDDRVVYGSQFYTSSTVPLETTAGGFVGYKYVTEKAIGATPADSLKTLYNFSFENALYSEFYYGSSRWQAEPKEWRRGKLLSKQLFKGNRVVYKEDYTYNFYSPHLAGDNYEDNVQEIRTDFVSYQSFSTHAGLMPPDFYDYSDDNPLAPHTYFYGIADYYVYPKMSTPYRVTLPYFTRYTGFDKIASKKTTIYDDSNNSIENTENYYYDKTPGHYQQSRIETKGSKGNILKTVNKYPLDKADMTSISVNASQAIDSMVNRKMKSPVIEIEKYRAGSLLEKTRNNYRVWDAGKIILPENIQYQSRNNLPEVKWQAYKYDSIGNLLEHAKQNDVRSAYIWDYRKSYPIANAVNATTTDIAYTSFENDGNGSWVIPSGLRDTLQYVTGRKAYALSNGAISRAGINSSRCYIVSYWSKSGSASVNGSSGTLLYSRRGWNYYEHKLSAGATNLTISGAITIDELRAYPADAQMITYTYDLLVGMTSQCDANNNISYYEYDGFGRLSVIRDQDGNILKSLEYNYKK